MALVSKKSIELSFATHYVDSIFIADFAKKNFTGNVLHDVGTGAGFPGVVFAIRFPDTKVILYERSLKKQTFLSAVLSHLSLSNLYLEGELPNKRQQGTFLARAVMPKEELFPFLAKKMVAQSRFILNRGGISEIFLPEKNFEKRDEIKYSLPMDCGDRIAECFEYVPRGTK